MLDDILDYWDQISKEWVQPNANPQFKDIIKIFKPNNEKSYNDIKMMYPITHSIGFIQSLSYLYDLCRISQKAMGRNNIDHQEKEYHNREKIKAAIRFLRDFKTSTHQ